MKHKFKITIGPVPNDDVATVLTLLNEIAPLMKVEAMPQENDPKRKTGIRRHTVTDADVTKMKELNNAGYSAEQIAGVIDCSKITVERHIPSIREINREISDDQ